MLKKTMIGVLALVFAVSLAAPARANAGVVVGIGVAPAVRPYGYVALPRPRTLLLRRPTWLWRQGMSIPMRIPTSEVL